MDNYITNTGSVETFVNKNGKKSLTKVIWNGDYNGTEANIDVNINKNGHDENMSITLDNNDILHLLNADADTYTIDERLTTDFLPTSALFKKSEMVKKGKKTKKGKQSNKKTKNRFI